MDTTVENAVDTPAEAEPVVDIEAAESGEKKLIFDPSAQKTGGLFELQSSFHRMIADKNLKVPTDENWRAF